MLKNSANCAGLALLGLTLWVPAVSAQEVVSPNGTTVVVEEEAGPEHGKINTADASPVDPGHFEIESSLVATHANRFWGSTGTSHARGQARELALGLAATAGVVADVDVAVSGGYVWLKDEDNDFDPDDGVFGPERGHDWGDLDLSGRYRFFASEEYGLELAYIGGVTIPTGSSASRGEIGTSQEFWSFNQTLAASKDWGKWTANAAIGYALPLGEKREGERGTFAVDAAVGYQFLPWLQPEVELNYARDFHASEDDQEVLAATVGLVMPLNDRLRVNSGVQQGLWGKNADKATCLLLAVKLAF